MAPISVSDSQRGRQLLAALVSIAAVVAALSVLLGAATPARADNIDPAPPVKVRPTPTPTFPTPTPICNPDFYPDSCPSASPSEVVVSPVAPDPTPSAATPSYLIGTLPSPTPNQDGTNTVSSPVPLGGGFVDQLPTPSAQASAAVGDLAPHQSGLPLPFIAVGVLLILGAVGSLIYAIAPRQKNAFTRERPTAPPSPVYFTPYGPDSPGTNLLTGGQSPRPGPKKPA